MDGLTTNIFSDEPDQVASSNRPRRPPPITPKRFTRFFTPRASTGRFTKSPLSKSGRQLRDITQEALNRRQDSHQASAQRKSILFVDVPHDETFQSTLSTPTSRKRKVLHSPASSPLQSSPCKRVQLRPPVDIPSSPPTIILEEESFHVPPRQNVVGAISRPAPLQRLRATNINARVLQRSFGGAESVGRGVRRDKCIYWQCETADFCSGPDDVHAFQHPALPFSVTSCNTNSLIAVGDEAGGVRLIDSNNHRNPQFSSTHIYFRPHDNALLDMSFSSDDLLLATASGDQTGRIIDMKTQMTKFILQGHDSSVKQIRFQPGNDSVVATSSRDGSVRLWDSRCRGSETTISERAVAMDPSSAVDAFYSHKAIYTSTYTTISNAHGDRRAFHNQPHLDGVRGNQRDNGGKGEAQSFSRAGDVSVTALSFFASGREHLLLTASESSTRIRLWDIRSRYSRQSHAVPVSTTSQPESHAKHRHFGISSLALGTNESRLYALSRDNTVYVYATSHLILGHAPELSPLSGARGNKYGHHGRAGLGPLYGFRHPSFHATSFYVKAAIRPPCGGRPELLAVGSSDRCAIIFPTDESFLQRQSDCPDLVGNLRESSNIGQPSQLTASTSTVPAQPASSRAPSGFSTRMMDTVPVFELGTALVHGHQKEVTGLTWTHCGQLISVSDDYTSRRWNENQTAARDLRVGGEAGGRRWGCGWADMGPDFDDTDT